MFTVSELSQEAENLMTELGESLDTFFASLGNQGEEVTLDGQGTYSFTHDLNEYFYLLLEGNLTITLEGKAVLYLQEGDAFGFSAFSKVPGAIVASDFAVRVRRFEYNVIRQECQADPKLSTLWQAVQDTHTALLFQLLVDGSEHESNVQPSIQYYSEGDTIITEAGVADKVYTLLEGEAAVFHAGVEVGRVLENEIFGALAALTDTKRTASVIAAKRCAVAALPTESFKSLIASRPNTTEKLIKDFARKIVDLNNKVAQK